MPRTSKIEFEKHRKAWGLNPEPYHYFVGKRVKHLVLQGYTPQQAMKKAAEEWRKYWKDGNPKQRYSKYVEARPSFQYAHETFLDWQAFKKAHPEATIRTITSDGHQLRIAYYGQVVGYRVVAGKRTPIHSEYALQSILHPREEEAPCAFMKAIRRTGKLRQLLMKGAMPLRVKAPANPVPRGKPLEIVYARGARSKGRGNPVGGYYTAGSVPPYPGYLYSPRAELFNPKRPHTEVAVSKLPKCDFCSAVALYDGKTTMGPWANMCPRHFRTYGIGLGLGKGQKLIEKKNPVEGYYTAGHVPPYPGYLYTPQAELW